MAINQSDVDIVKEQLIEGENVLLTANQRRIGPGGSATTPTTVVATDKKVILVNRATLGIRKDFEIIPYRQITSVRLESGIISSTVFIRVQGYDRDQGLLKNGREEGEIDGLGKNDAKQLADIINKMLVTGPVEEFGQNSGVTPSGAGGSIYCQSCGAKNSLSSKFCASCGKQLKK